MNQLFTNSEAGLTTWGWTFIATALTFILMLVTLYQARKGHVQARKRRKEAQAEQAHQALLAGKHEVENQTGRLYLELRGPGNHHARVPIALTGDQLWDLTDPGNERGAQVLQTAVLDTMMRADLILRVSNTVT
jgi:hypothetical protein